MLGKSKVKYIQSLGQKKLRDAEGVFIAEGPKIVAELAASGNAVIQEIYAVKEWLDAHSREVQTTGITEVSEDELGKISQLATANQVLAVVKKMEAAPIDTGNTVSLALDTIQDPGNLGTIIRIADWFGISQVICSPGCADIYNPKVVQATMGSIARVRVLYTDLTAWLSLQKDSRIYAAALEGQDIATVKKLQAGIIVIGNESKGISPGVMELVNVKITIPRKGKAESLNAAVAAGIVLSHMI
jgi:RNA methyltransferase, TrmH family